MIIYSGIFVGSKPNFNLLLMPIVKQLKELEYGVLIKQQNHCEKILRFFLLFGVFDKPARASITNCKLCTGYFGCKCLQEGNKDLFYFLVNFGKM